MSCASDSEIHQDDPVNPPITDITIDPILLSQGRSHGIKQSPLLTGVKSPEIRQPTPSMAFATPPRNTAAPSGIPSQPRFPDSSPNTVVMQTPRNHHGLPAFPLAAPAMEVNGPSGTSAQFRGLDSSPSTKVFQNPPGSEFGFLRTAANPHVLTVSEGHPYDYDITTPQRETR